MVAARGALPSRLKPVDILRKGRAEGGGGGEGGGGCRGRRRGVVVGEGKDPANFYLKAREQAFKGAF